jgi:hypothetical protein
MEEKLYGNVIINLVLLDDLEGVKGTVESMPSRFERKIKLNS